MFKYDKTGIVYYSVREKIKHYSKIAYNDKTATDGQKQHALKRLSQLKALDKTVYDEPTMIVTNDKHFGNGINKPRACVVVGQDEKKRLIVSPVHDRTISTVILDRDISRQVDSTEKRIDSSEVYELKNISGLKSLTVNDKKKIKEIHGKK